MDPSAAGRWNGWRAGGLTPASEHWLLLRKPTRNSAAANLLDYGVGALNFEAGKNGERLPTNAVFSHHPDCREVGSKTVRSTGHWPAQRMSGYGRQPRAVSADPEVDDRRVAQEAVAVFECVAGCPVTQLGDAQRFFFVAKPSFAERSAGLPYPNPHEAVKPVAFLKHLVSLIAPAGGRVLDGFAGSGSVGCAVLACGGDRTYTGIEEQPEYVAIANARIAHWAAETASSDKTADAS